jgi:hypothetical protein
MEYQAFSVAFGNLIAKAWADENFKNELINDTMGVFERNGIDIPKGVEFKVIESYDRQNKRINLLLPPFPQSVLDPFESDFFGIKNICRNDDDCDYCSDCSDCPDDDKDPCPWDDCDRHVCDQDGDYMDEDGNWSNSPCYHGDDF